AVHDDAQRALGLGGGDGGADLLFAGHIGGLEQAPQFGGDLGAGGAGQVDDRDDGAGGGETTGGGKAQPAGAAGDEGSGSVDVHGFSVESAVPGYRWPQGSSGGRLAACRSA